MKKLFKMMRIPFSWKIVKQTDVWTYKENTITGERCVESTKPDSYGYKPFIGYQPIDKKWLKEGRGGKVIINGQHIDY